MILEKVNSPEDLKKLSRSELPQLCEELRAFWSKASRRPADTWPPIWGRWS